MERPLGVTVLAAAMILAGLACAAAGVIFFMVGSKGATAAAPDSGVAAALLAALGAAGGVLALLFGVLHVVLAIGIFQIAPPGADPYYFPVSADWSGGVSRINRDAAELQPRGAAVERVHPGGGFAGALVHFASGDEGSVFAGGSWPS